LPGSAFVGDELPALRAVERGGDRHLDSELVGPVRLALADAFDLGGVQRIDLSSALVLALMPHPESQRQRFGENPAQGLVAPCLAHDVAEDPAEIGPHAAQRPVGALELLGVGVALVGHQRPLAHARIGLAQAHPVLLGEPHQPLARPMHQLGVGRKRHRLRLHGGVDDHLGEVRRLGRAGSCRRVQALLDQRDKLLLAHPLAPARQRRPIERGFVDEELLAAKKLKVRVLDPARAEILVGEIVCVLEDRKARHQPCGQRRMARLVGIDRPEPLLQKSPVDRRGELRQRMTQVDDLVEPGLEKIALPAVPTLLRPHRESLRRLSSDRESRLAA